MSVERNLFYGIIRCYSILVDCIRIVLFPVIKGYAREKGWDLDKRQKLPSPLRDFRGKRVVWLHAASLGEMKLLVKFHAMLHQRREDELYLVTGTTRNGVAYLEKNRHASFCATGFLPIDTITLVSRIVSHYAVCRVWLLETEIWPSLLHVCLRRNIPVGIVNGRLEEDSFTWYRRFRWFFAQLLEAVDIVLAQSDVYAERFAALGIPRKVIHVVGNIKGHIRIQRPKKKEWLDIRRRLNITEDDFVVTAGCMHAGEGKVLRTFVPQMEKLGYPCRLVVVPRYTGEAGDLLDEIGGNTLHLTETETLRRWNICIVEKMGILDDMYKAADAAIVGGTFVDIGGHNVWDAACYAIPVFYGPHVETQKESCRLLDNAGVGFSVSDGESMAERMFTVLKKQPMQFLKAQEAFIETTNRTRSIVEPLLP